MIQVPVSIGELIDKLSILYVKKTRVFNEQKLAFINDEFQLLYNISSFYLENDKISELYDKLIKVNSKLWDIEDELRIIESTKEFDLTFIDLARKVYYTNDERFLIKNKINELTNSNIREQKDYKNY